ncbi:MAG: YfhO family protein [Saprospiraceae bacterium]|nr:YfhO family protein [Saprospiraceae bacterium]
MDFKKWLPDLVVLGIFLALTYITFAPAFSGKIMDQYDIEGYKGMASEIKDYQEKEGKTIHWTNSAYSGMPTYIVSNDVFLESNIARKVNRWIRKAFPNPSGLLFIGLICFYILARTLKINRWLAVAGAAAFMLGTFVMTSIEAGHASKINAYAYTPLILAGLLLLFQQKKYLLGLLALSFGLAAQIASNHVQITFYIFLICLVYSIYELIQHIKGGQLKELIKASAFALAGVLIGVGVNYNLLATIQNYSKESTRSTSALTPLPGGNPSQGYEYATGWSYAPMESMTLLIPRFMGGTSAEPLGEQSSWSGNRQIPASLQENPPTYWGKLPSTSSPVYVGVIISFLFIFAFFIQKGAFRWWILIASVLLLLLSWGKYSPGVYDIFYNFFPFFDKFRTPMMALLMMGLLWPMFGFLGLDRLVQSEDTSTFLKPFYISLGITGGLVLVFGLLGSFMYSFNGLVDEQLRAGGFSMEMLQQLKADRVKLLQLDSLRSLLFLGLGAGAIWLYLKDMIQAKWVLAGVAILSFLDIALVNKRYVNADDYEESNVFNRKLSADGVDQAILQDNDLHYRVFNNSPSVMAEATTSSNHKSIGGYSAAKLLRYQDIFDRQVGRENTENILAMLNAKYFIGLNQNGQKGYQQNSRALGNAWFVNNVQFGANADEEMRLLGSADFNDIAILPVSVQGEIPTLLSKANNGIELTSYHPERLEYKARNGNTSSQFAVFSEIFYQSKNGDGWQAYINGEKVPHYRTNYALRGLVIPEGDHDIVFQFEHPAFNRQAMISKIASGLILLLGLGIIVLQFLGRKKAESVEVEA